MIPNCRRGYGQLGQLGHPGEVDHVVPKKVALLSKAGVAMLVSGPAAKSSAAVGGDGKVYTFGCGRDGRLGHGSGLDAVNQDVPKAVTGISVRLWLALRRIEMGLRGAWGSAACSTSAIRCFARAAVREPSRLPRCPALFVALAAG